MKTLKASVALALVALAPCGLASLATAAKKPDIPRTWTGNFETGNFRQWANRIFRPGDVKLVHSIRRQGRYAARFVVHPGDHVAGSGERAELSASPEQTAGYAGMDVYYGWSTFFPLDFNPVRATWNTFAQWHSTGTYPCNPANIAFRARLSKGWIRPRYQVHVAGGNIARSCRPGAGHTFTFGPIALRRWNDFVLHVKWSPERSVGFVEAWINGRRVIPRTHMATLFGGRDAYVKQGLYRGPGKHTTKVIQDAMTRGPTFASVNPGRFRHPVPKLPVRRR